MINLMNLLDVIASGEPIEVIDMANPTEAINPRKGEVLLYPFEEYEVMSIYSSVDVHMESYTLIDVRRWK